MDKVYNIENVTPKSENLNHIGLFNDTKSSKKKA